ncbi:hypothetical protein HDC94_000900 [Leifsonia sp. AK011]|uniref:hypothetical protein n=1 Tax=Leifsonia sp. AK011 TaxID=2723075 RepID=UPI0015CB906E|nr:hypothetical protein [Leifsonia sp. AK011]NYF09744.1 hypothetical protein [Leifsonia sp. AK011]
MSALTDAAKAFFAKKATIIVQLNARLQPIHRGDLEDAIVEKLGASIPSLTVVGGGSAVDKDGRITSCGIELMLLKSSLELALTELASALVEFGVPRGSILVTPPKRTIKVGQSEGLAVTFPRISRVDFEDARALQHNEELDRAMELLKPALRAHGRVWSWQILRDEADLVIYGDDSEALRDIIRDTLPREGAFAGYRITAIT